jgi:DNA repair protein RadC
MGFELYGAASQRVALGFNDGYECWKDTTTAKRAAHARQRRRIPSAKAILSPRDIYRQLRVSKNARQERVFLFCLDTRGCAIKRDIVSVGTLNAALIHPREIFYPAIINNAASVIVAHNHPSGDPTPSDEDVNVTRMLAKAGEIIGISVLDHVVVARDGYTSLREKGYL